MPKVDGGGIKVPLDQLHEIAAQDEITHSQRR